MNIKTQSLNFSITEDNSTHSMNENTIVDIPINKIKEISNQPFVIHEDTVNTIADSIKLNGQLDPCVVTKSNNGYYELLAGRHRKRACELAGLTTVKCIIKNNLSDDEKELIIIDTNTERNNNYLPSELAFAFKRKEELLSKTTNSAIKIIADESNLSRKKVYRYIRLTYLIKPLLNRVDSGNIPLIAGVELSYLTDKQQGDVFSYLINHASSCKITTEKARLIKDNPADYIAIFEDVFSSVGIPQLENVDNLSTNQVEQNVKSTNNTNNFEDNEVINIKTNSINKSQISNENANENTLDLEEEVTEENLDNLSTVQIEQTDNATNNTNNFKDDEVTNIKNNSINKSQISEEVIKTENVDNLSTLPSKETTERVRVTTLEDELIKIIIDITHIDSSICSFLSKDEVTKLLCEFNFDETINNIKCLFDGTYFSFISSDFNKYISAINIYDIVRDYIKNNYSVEQIIEAYNYYHIKGNKE